MRAGGRRGFTWYLAILVVRLGFQAAMTLSGMGEFCARSVELCPTALRFAFPYLYVAAGLAAGALVIRVLRAGPEGRNVILNGAGAYAMFGTPVSLAFFLVRPQDFVSASAMDFALNGVAALIAGVVLRLRSPRLTPAALLAGAMVLIWLVSVGPFLLSLGQSGASQPASLYISGLTQALLLGIGWSVTDRAQRARTTAAA